ncbi:hypothetical protein Q8A64_08620 [Oxalobacteraceae bacterium R-40]|uniref:Uncharacterized protein n=1 Tax=Keguizhuia sedimenti TaxID=3064264 RepID=A0ABU1BN97_9BURK|nr:hypothetical protein [Oxalobacteraceae bacterium R-40]
MMDIEEIFFAIACLRLSGMNSASHFLMREIPHFFDGISVFTNRFALHDFRHKLFTANMNKVHGQ